MISGAPIRVVVADFMRFSSEAICRALNATEGYDATRASHSENFSELVGRGDIDVVMIAALPSKSDPFAMAREVRQASPSTKVLFVGADPPDILLDVAMACTPAGYLVDDEPLGAVATAIRRVHAGQQFFSDSIARRLERHPISGVCRSNGLGKISRLTDRQLEVLRLLAVGRSVKEVASEMRLSVKSIDSHKYRIMNKLGIHDRVELARFAIREGLVTP